MPAVKDYRTYAALDLAKVDAAGKDLGKGVYWKLYAIENMVRVLVHSVLTAQIGATWWATVAPPWMKKEVLDRINRYANNPWHSDPGKHEVYHCLLTELIRIMGDNVNQFTPVIPQATAWVGKLEQLKLPRNVVGHMNWLSKADRQRIDVIHADIQALLKQVASSGTVPILIPPV